MQNISVMYINNCLQMSVRLVGHHRLEQTTYFMWI